LKEKSKNNRAFTKCNLFTVLMPSSYEGCKEKVASSKLSDTNS
jgi:hypothetical protein